MRLPGFMQDSNPRHTWCIGLRIHAIMPADCRRYLWFNSRFRLTHDETEVAEELDGGSRSRRESHARER